MQNTQKDSKEKGKKYVRVRDEIAPALEEAVLSNFHRTRIFLTWNEGVRTIRQRVTMVDFLHDAWSYVKTGQVTVSVDEPAVEDTVQMIFDILSDVCERNGCEIAGKCVVTGDCAEISVRPNVLSDGLKIKRFGSVSEGGCDMPGKKCK